MQVVLLKCVMQVFMSIARVVQFTLHVDRTSCTIYSSCRSHELYNATLHVDRTSCTIY
ncbi:hypothetical protein [Microcoleus sp. bin38.metabat.b11b12b14.051]|uniref:hypothetical protein n=1 Tax=Microcoleus sp. bin38.metabat.b11b12b14.051 TaxID=2742709 RepID=UPI0025F5A770|nr:hypothetical protein [Microcoleus sp. bin38.metabat.b11b12b14.051]